MIAVDSIKSEPGKDGKECLCDEWPNDPEQFSYYHLTSINS